MGTSGGPGKIDNLNYGDQMEKMAQVNAKRGGTLYRTAMPLYGEMVGQTLEGLKTGGIGAQIPTIQRAVEQSKIATSNAMSQADDRLRGAGISGSPFGQNIMSNIANQGALATSRIPTEIVQSFISGAPGLSAQGFGASNNYAGLGGNILGNLQQLDLSRQQGNQQQFQAFMDAIREYAQSVGGMAGGMCLHPATEIDLADGTRKPIEAVVEGDLVASLDADGFDCVGRVVGKVTCDVHDDHRMVVMTAPDATTFIVTPGHPLPDGEPVSSLHPRKVVWGATRQTMDLLVDSPSGVYFVHGFALGSTLDSRHKKVA